MSNIVILIFFLVSCSNVVQTQKIMVEGFQHDVLTLTTPNTYSAYKTKWSERTKYGTNPSDFILNIMAIEAITECKVIRESIINNAFITTAAVECNDAKVK